MQPTGVAKVGNQIWFSDAFTGSLVGLDSNGEEFWRVDGLQEPLGITIMNGVVCVAEAGANRISCWR